MANGDGNPAAPPPPGGGGGNNGNIDIDGNTPTSRERLLAFAAGFALLLILLAIALKAPDLEDNFIVRVVLAISASAFSVFIPGAIGLNLDNRIKAAGSLAIFIAVMAFAPAVQKSIQAPLTDSYSYRTPDTGKPTFGDFVAHLQDFYGITVNFDSGCPSDLNSMPLKLKLGIHGSNQVEAIQNSLSIRADAGSMKVSSFEATFSTSSKILSVKCHAPAV